MSAKNKSQTQEIIAFLRKNKSITSLQAFNMFNATRLSGIIFVLKKEVLVSIPKLFKVKIDMDI